MNKKILASILFLFITSSESASSQTMRPLSNGFSIGRSSGISSNFLQISNSEANALVDILSKNVSGNLSGHPRAIPDDEYTINDNLIPFSIIINKNSNSGGSSETRINNSVFSGHTHSIFVQ